MNGTLVGTVRGISPRMLMMLKVFRGLGVSAGAPSSGWCVPENLGLG